MPNVSPLLDSVLNALNKANNTVVPVPADVRIKSFVPNGAQATVTIQGKATKPNYGEYTFTIDRVALSDVFGKKPYGLGTALNVAGTTNVSQLLTQIGYRYGLRLPASEFQNDGIAWSNGTATVTVRALDTSAHFYGSVALTLTETPIDITTLFTKNFVVPTANMTVIEFGKLVETANLRAYPLDLFDFTDVKTTAEAGVSLGTYNSVVAVKGKPGSGYTGTYNVFYSRRDLSTYTGQTMSVPDNFAGDLYAALAYENLGIGPMVVASDLVNQPVVVGSTVSLKAVAGSLNAFGVGTPKVLRYSDDIQTVNLVYAADVGKAKGWLETEVKAKVPRAGKLILNITVNAGVTIASSDITVATFAFAKMPTFGIVELHLKNLGTIVGRGSGRGGFTISSAGNSAISVADDFNGTIEIDNQGLIAGGGGGGSSVSKFGTNSTWYYSNGGGGCALGENYANSSSTGSSYYNGGNGTLTAGGVGGGKGIYTGNGYQSAGDGGGPGEPGKPGFTRDATGSIYRPANASDGLRPAAKSIVGNVGLIHWVNRGRVKPHYIDKLARLQAYIDSQTDVANGAPDTTIGNLAASNAVKRVAMKWVGGVSLYLNDVFISVGDPQGFRVAQNTNLIGLFAACAPNADVAGVVGRQSMSALFTLEPAAAGTAVASTTRNNMTNNAMIASLAGWNVTSFIYYDPYLDEVMECNPFKKTTPVRWSGMKDSLATMNGVLNGF